MNPGTSTVREKARSLRRIVLQREGPPVCRTVAEAWRISLSPDARIDEVPVLPPPDLHTMVISVAGGPDEEPLGRVMWKDGEGAHLHATHPSFLYPLYALVAEEWADEPWASFSDGVTYRPSFPWLRNLNDFFVGSLRTARGFDRTSFVKQLARDGFTHVTVNGLGVPRPFESGPPGDVYHWFYDYSPDLDQFVDSALVRGYYPPDYLRANCDALRGHAALARAYGLVPNLHINSPRSMPEEFWQRYGYLRGPRVDHPRETLRPRYALTMAHPAVQHHYRVLLRRILEEVPDLGFIHIWTNDSGAGFEFVSSLYAGRNGGPYLLREWNNDETIARAAAGNVLTYYRLLAGEGRRVNPAFRVICDLGPFFRERAFIIPALGNGLDAGDFAYFEEQPGSPPREAIEATGAMVHRKLDLCDNNVLGVPAPFLVSERLHDAYRSGARAALANIVPPSLAPFDVNGEVIRAFQMHRDEPLEGLLLRCARKWGGESGTDVLLTVWRLADAAVRAYPPDIPMSTFAFPWFRLWVRPLVPDIGAIPEADRQYYEDFLLATFNNPARVDLNNDMMWNFLTVAQAGARRRQVDERVLPPLAQAIDLCAMMARDQKSGKGLLEIYQDLHDRLSASRCFYATMRNVVGWIEAVHGYRQAATDADRARFRAFARDVTDGELENARSLLSLWQTSTVAFMPVSSLGESLHMYGKNFGDLLTRKITLMEQHRDDEPYIDPDFMWRMSQSGVTLTDASGAERRPHSRPGE